MLQHVLLGDIAPLLLLLSLSRVMMRPATRRLAAIERRLGRLAHPVTGLVAWLVLMYLWHIPALYDAALEHPLVHLLEHVSFFSAGVAVWWPLIQPVPMRRPLKGLWPIAYIGTAKFGLAALGLYLTWSGTAIYPYYERRAADLGPVGRRGPERGRRGDDARAVAHVRDRARRRLRADARPARRRKSGGASGLEEAQVPASNVDVISTGP